MASRKGNGGTGWVKSTTGEWIQTKTNPDLISKAEEILTTVRAKNAERVAGVAAALPPDAELFKRAKAVLLDLAQNAGEAKDRIAAAKALVDAVRPSPSAARGEDDLRGLSPEELKAEVEAARKALGAGELAQ
jgi:hypothetical protein